MGVDPFTALGIDQAPPMSTGSDGIPMMRVTPAGKGGIDPFKALGIDAAQLPPPAAPPQPQPSNQIGADWSTVLGKHVKNAAIGMVSSLVDPALQLLTPHPFGTIDEQGNSVPPSHGPVQSALEWLGGKPSDVAQGTPGQELAGKMAGGAMGMIAGGGMMPGGAGTGLGRALGSVAKDAFAGGVGAGVGAAAGSAVPESVAPIVEAVTNIPATALTAGGIGAAQSAAGNRFTRQDVGGIRATPKQLSAAVGMVNKALGPEGQQQLNAAGEAEAQARALEAMPARTPEQEAQLTALQPQREQIVPGERPTLGQVAPTPGMKGLERDIRSTDEQTFNAQRAATNNARVGIVRNPTGAIPDAADPVVLGQHFRGMLQALDAADEANATAGRTALTSQGDQAAGVARQAVQGATGRLGGTAAPEDAGTVLRGSLAARNEAAKKAERELWGAVDPEGKLTLPLGEVQQTARGLMRDLNPNLGDAINAQEGQILSGAASLPEVVPFRDAQRLRSNIGQVERTLRATPGNDQSLRRLGILKSSLDDAIANGASAAAAADSEVASRILSTLQREGVGGSEQTGGASGLGVAANAAPRTDSGAGAGGSQGEEGRGRGGAASDSGVAPQAADRGRKAESLIDFLIRRGGIQDQGGELRANDLQTVHHRAGGRLVNPRGLPLDYAREAATEAGFLPQSADVNDFLDAVTSRTPVYRIDETAEAGVNAQRQQDAAREQHDRFMAGANIQEAAGSLGVRLTPAEEARAAELHLHGAHPEDAIRQAAIEGESAVFQRNAEHNAIGSPGVPLAARQAEMPIAGGGTVKPNFDTEAASRYADARAATLARKQTFGTGPVGDVLRPGKAGADFNTENAAVARQFLNSGPTEPARVQQFIDAVGGEPQAVSAMRDALVNDLRQKRIIDENGMVDAKKLTQWVQPDRRGRTIDLFPGLREDLGTAEAAQRTYDQTVADNAARLDAFNKQAAADHIARAKAFDQSGGRFASMEPEAALRSLYASKNSARDFADVVRQAEGIPEVMDGLRRLVADDLSKRFEGAQPTGPNEGMLKWDGLRRFVDERREPLKLVFGGQGVQNIDRVIASMRREQMANAVPATPGSNTVSKVMGAAKLGGHALGGAGIGTTAFALIGEHLLENASHMLGSGHMVQTGAALAGAAGGILAHSLRQAGIHTRNELIGAMIRDPALTRELQARVAAHRLPAMTAARVARALQASTIATQARTE